MASEMSDEGSDRERTGREKTPKPADKKRKLRARSSPRSSSASHPDVFTGFDKDNAVVTCRVLDSVTDGINARMDSIQEMLAQLLDKWQPQASSSSTEQPGPSGLNATVAGVADMQNVSPVMDNNGSSAPAPPVNVEVYDYMYDEDYVDEDDDYLRYGSGMDGVSFDVPLPGSVASADVSAASAGVIGSPVVQDAGVMEGLLAEYKQDILGFEHVGVPVFQAMADTLAECLYQQPNRASLDKLLKAYPCPANVPRLKPLDMNDELITVMSRLGRNIDVMLRDVCGLTSTIMVPYLTYMSDHHNKDLKPLVDYYRMFSDAIRLSAMNMSYISHVRKLVIKLLFKSPAIRSKCSWATKFGEQKVFPFPSINDMTYAYMPI